jgi:hypothetical protein
MKKGFTVSRLRMFRRWMGLLEIEGKTQYLRELEMWLKSFERYFNIANLPLTDHEIRRSTLRDYSEELRIIGDVIFRVSQVCALLLTEEQLSYSSFTKYIENSLKHDHFTDGNIRKIIRDQRPSRNISMLMESLLDVRTTAIELSQLSKVSYLCFGAVGRTINREIRNEVFFDFFLERKFETLFDKVNNPPIIQIVRSIQVPMYKRSIAAVLLEFQRILRYLHGIGLQMQEQSSLKRSLPIFSLIHAELKWALQYLEDQFLRREHPDIHFAELIEGITYSLTMELRKVMQRELVGVAALQQYELIFTKIQNSQGILLNAVQQVVFAIAHYFNPRLQGHDLFPDYVTRREQSIQLRSDILELKDYVDQFMQTSDLHHLSDLIKKIEWFRNNSMKYLMYKDWFEFDSFYHEVCACKSTGNLNFTLHRYLVFLSALIKEVNKRAIFYKVS